MTEHYQRRQSDQIRENIDALIVSATSIETKEILNLFRNMDDKLKDISNTLHEQNSRNAENELKISQVLTRLEERLTAHEKEYAANRVKSDVWKRIINSGGGGALLFCTWMATQYFDLRDSKLRTESRLEVAEKLIANNQIEVSTLREVVNTLRIDKVQEQVGILKKKHARLDKLAVIRHSVVLK